MTATFLREAAARAPGAGARRVRRRGRRGRSERDSLFAATGGVLRHPRARWTPGSSSTRRRAEDAENLARAARATYARRVKLRRLGRVSLLVAAAALPPGLAFVASDAEASAAYDSPYTYEQTFGTALRLVRVDLGLKVTEKDAELGYVLFEYTSPESGKRATPGSFEFVRNERGVLVTAQLPAMPQYHEQVLVDRLARKLATEYGEPPRRASPPPAAPSPDGGADGG